MTRTFLSFSLALCAWHVRAQTPGSLDMTFNPADVGYSLHDGLHDGIGANNEFVEDLVLMADGRMVIVGSFYRHEAYVHRQVARVLADGTPDTTFIAAQILGGPVNCVALQADGRVLVGGRFETVGGLPYASLVRFNVDGTVDTSFDIGTGFMSSATLEGTLYNIVVQPDGRIICSGTWATFDGVALGQPIRLNSDGSHDPSFMMGTGLDGVVDHLRLQPDGKLLAAGSFAQYNGAPRSHIARILPTGALDTGFAPTFAGGSSCNGLDLRDDGKIWVSGNWSSVNGVPRDGFALLTAGGATDPSFDPASLNGFVTCLKGQADGKLLVGWHINEPWGPDQEFLSRFNADGSLDPAFAAPDFNATVEDLKLLPDQRILVMGWFTRYGLRGENAFTRLMPDGTVDPDWPQASAFDHGVWRVLRLADGSLLCGGSFYAYDHRAANRMARLFPDGQHDTTFFAWPNINNQVLDLAVQPDGRIMVAGRFISPFDSTYSNRVMRLFPNGDRDTTFLAYDGLPTVNRIALQPDGKVICMTGAGVYRLLSTGPLDPAFTSGTSPGALLDMLYVPGGDILVAGGTNTYAGQTVGAVFRLNSDGSLDPGFSMGTGLNSGYVNDIERQPDGKILITGSGFTSVNGTPAVRIARLNANGSVDIGFNTGTGLDATGTLVKVAPSGRIFVSGNFLNVNGTPMSRFARLNSDGSLDTGFDPGAGPQYAISDIAINAAEDLYIAGGFTHYDGTGRNRIAKVFGGFSTDLAEREAADAPLQVLPVPGAGPFTVDAGAAWDPQGHPELLIVDALGQVVMRQAWDRSRITFQLDAAPGTYRVVLSDQGRTLGSAALVLHR